MHKILCRVLFAMPACGLTAALAYAGPCSKEIAKIEEVMADPGPMIGPTDPQSLGAQLHRQPTPSSVARAKKRANQRYKHALARASALNAKGDPDCMRAVTEVKDLIGMQ